VQDSKTRARPGPTHAHPWAPAIANEVLELLRRFPVPLFVPAAGIGLVANALQLVRNPLAVVGVAVALALLFELYVAYVERLVMAAEAGAATIRITALTWHALPLVPALFVASIAALALPLAASGALVLPGVWLLTRWSLFAPAIARNRLGPGAALALSNELVRGRFWFAFATATVPLLVEHGVVHGTALAAEPVLGSDALAMVAAGIAVAAASPVAALSISLVFDRLVARRDA
jgi:hypothetical protein